MSKKKPKPIPPPSPSGGGGAGLVRSATDRPEVIEYAVKVREGLSPKQQFWWGFFGGAMIVVFQLGGFAKNLAFAAPWPHMDYKLVLTILSGVAFPIISGFLSRVLDPHHKLMAVFEGASAPALFMLIAQQPHP